MDPYHGFIDVRTSGCWRDRGRRLRVEMSGRVGVCLGGMWLMVVCVPESLSQEALELDLDAHIIRSMHIPLYHFSTHLHASGC